MYVAFNAIKHTSKIPVVLLKPTERNWISPTNIIYSTEGAFYSILVKGCSQEHDIGEGAQTAH